MYDVIGDIHGHADELVSLLNALGYRLARGTYQHSESKAVFLGDFIDRGPQIRRVLEIVRPMVTGGHALAVMGNHELNALAYHTRDASGEYLRCHSEKNNRQHHKTLRQLEAQELHSYLEWFRTLPLWLELAGLRVVHACWDVREMEKVQQSFDLHKGITDAFLASACVKDGALFAPVETVLKGRETALPLDCSFRDKDGHVRTHIRTRWYLPPDGHTYRTYAFQSDEITCELPLGESVLAESSPYPVHAKPVFIGHYWLSAPRPQMLADNVACLDYSVAKGGSLCAYRWQGEQKLSNDHFVWVSR